MTNTDVKHSYRGWRSLLFVPVHQQSLIAKAHTRGADALILDLEDSVPLDQKALARQVLPAAAAELKARGMSVLVRINQKPDMASQDLIAVINPNVDALVLPKVESASQIKTIAAQIDELEAAQAMPAGHTQLIALIESVEALPLLDEIASAHPRLVAMTLGSEDFCATARMQPNTNTLMMPTQMLAFACRRAGITPLGFPGSIADYSDMTTFRETASLARQLGMAGAFCIHPKQVNALNEGLAPSDEEIDHARKLLAAFDEGLKVGKGAIEFQGKMVDMPVVLRARELIRGIE